MHTRNGVDLSGSLEITELTQINDALIYGAKDFHYAVSDRTIERHGPLLFDRQAAGYGGLSSLKIEYIDFDLNERSILLDGVTEREGIELLFPTMTATWTCCGPRAQSDKSEYYIHTWKAAKISPLLLDMANGKNVDLDSLKHLLADFKSKTPSHYLYLLQSSAGELDNFAITLRRNEVDRAKKTPGGLVKNPSEQDYRAKLSEHKGELD